MAANYMIDNAALYRKTLLDDIMPFWMKYSLDPAGGAINNCLDDEGNILSRDRFMWSQGRALWTFSALYNRIEKRREWLEVADGLYRYISTHGRDETGRWMYRLSEDGQILERDTSIYVDGFVLNGLGEYYAATGKDAAAELAIETFHNVLARISRPGSYGTAPYEIPPGMKPLAVPMLFSFFFYILGRQVGRDDIAEAGRRLGREILDQFYRPEMNVVLEFVTEDGKAKTDFPAGRVCIPGHVLEAMWFLVTIFEETGDDEAIAQCCDLIRRHLELAWDEDYGGLRLAMDVEGKQPIGWHKADCKPWWVQIEAMVATGYAYKHTGDDWSLAWHRRVQEWAYAHYRHPAGEWTQWLDRKGNEAESAALPVKDPFHLPRGLIYLINLFSK